VWKTRIVMGCAYSTVKVAKVEDNYHVSGDDKASLTNRTTEEKVVVLETHISTIKAKPSKLNGNLPTKSKANPSKFNPKDDSDWTPTIDTDIFNEKGGGRLTTTAVDKNANEQILV
jgi:hypothetical protein